MSGETVLVTGGSGFIGSHCIVALLQAGYRVRTTVRALSREQFVRDVVTHGGAEGGDRLSFYAADLTSDDGWDAAVAGSEFVLHVASPFPVSEPKNEDDLIVPARDGALRVLRAAARSNVKRVVLTSSFAAIGYSADAHARTLTESDWTDVATPGIRPYVKSKTVAEHAAWDFIEKEGNSLELAVVNPVGVFGPVLAPDYSTSIEIVRRLLAGEIPGIPDLWFGVVDVRDVADLHLRAMTNSAAAGERFLAVAGEPMSMQQIASVLRDRLGAAAAKVPSRPLPSWILRLGSLFDASLRQVTGDLGKIKRPSNEKAKSKLGWSPRSNEEAVYATGESLVRLGVVEKAAAAT